MQFHPWHILCQLEFKKRKTFLKVKLLRVDIFSQQKNKEIQIQKAANIFVKLLNMLLNLEIMKNICQNLRNLR